jgi:transposase-like protein
MPCRHCGSADLRKHGTANGAQRFRCRSCGRYGSDKPPRYSGAVKAQALDMYLNNVGIRKIARFVGASPAGVLKWIRAEHDRVQARLAQAEPPGQPTGPDIIEMDEIYTFVQKNSSVP